MKRLDDKNVSTVESPKKEKDISVELTNNELDRVVGGTGSNMFSDVLTEFVSGK